jgi:ankyrin repeat domain-containing protein 50
MRRRNRFGVLLGIYPKKSGTAETAPELNVQASRTAVSITDPCNSATELTAKTESGNLALELAIVQHLNGLPKLEREAFRETSKNFTDQSLLLHVRICDEDHKVHSHFQPQAENLSRFLGLLDRFMAGVTIGLQANPDISAIVVGGVRLVIDLAVRFMTFFTKLSDMLCRFGDFLQPLTKHVKSAQREDLVLKTLAAVYGDLLQLCKNAYGTFTNQGVTRSWKSWGVFWRIQWIPFEEEFGRIKTDMKHHLDVLSHSGRAIALNASLDASSAETERRRRERSWYIQCPNTVAMQLTWNSPQLKKERISELDFKDRIRKDARGHIR